MSLSIKPEASQASHGLKKVLNGGGGLTTITPPSPLEASQVVKQEPLPQQSRIMSPNLNSQASSSSDSEPQKRVQNNNTSSYTSGGRLKFFKGKRISGSCSKIFEKNNNHLSSDRWFLNPYHSLNSKWPLLTLKLSNFKVFEYFSNCCFPNFIS